MPLKQSLAIFHQEIAYPILQVSQKSISKNEGCGIASTTFHWNPLFDELLVIDEESDVWLG